MSGGGFAAGFALAATACAALAIVALYLRHRRGQRRVVPSLVVWHRLGGTASGARARLRWWISLTAALAVCALVGAAVAPGLRDATPADERMLVIDTSVTMHARTSTGEPRVTRAIRLATQSLRELPAGARVQLADTTGQLPPRGWLAREDALAALEHFAPVPVARSAVWPADVANGRAMLFTDGVSPLAHDAAVQVVSAFEPADNAGIVSFEMRTTPAAPDRREAVLRVANGSLRVREIDVTLESGSHRSARRLSVPAGATVAEDFDVSGFGEGVLTARIAMPDDALAADDFAFAHLPSATALSVLLVTRGRPDLRIALALLPGVSVRETDPAGYEREGPGDASVVVLDAFEPRVPPAVPVLAFGSPRLAAGGTWVWPGRPEGVSGRHALVTALAWGDVRVDRTPRWSAGDDALVRGSLAHDVTLIGETAATPARIDVAFRLEDSNLSGQGRFPAFLSAALERLAAARTPTVSRPGTVVVEGDGPESVRRVDSGADVALFRTTAGLAFVAQGPGVFMLEGGGGHRTVVVAPPAVPATFVNATALPPGGVPPTRRAVARTGFEPWRALCLGGAAVLLLLEAFAFARRRTE